MYADTYVKTIKMVNASAGDTDHCKYEVFAFSQSVDKPIIYGTV